MNLSVHNKNTMWYIMMNFRVHLLRKESNISMNILTARENLVTINLENATFRKAKEYLKTHDGIIRLHICVMDHHFVKGNLLNMLLKYCEENGIKAFILCFDGSKELVEDFIRKNKCKATVESKLRNTVVRFGISDDHFVDVNKHKISVYNDSKETKEIFSKPRLYYDTEIQKEVLTESIAPDTSSVGSFLETSSAFRVGKDILCFNYENALQWRVERLIKRAKGGIKRVHLFATNPYKFTETNFSSLVKKCQNKGIRVIVHVFHDFDSKRSYNKISEWVGEEKYVTVERMTQTLILNSGNVTINVAPSTQTISSNREAAYFQMNVKRKGSETRENFYMIR